MCDTMAVLRDRGALFGKNSDRPVGEVQVFEAHAPRPAGGRLRTQYLEIPDTGAFALMGGRPTWLWGMEHGVNEHRVAIGNEELYTADDPRLDPDGLIGMDLVRLGLERGRSAEHALDIVTNLLETYGQGGACDERSGHRYYSSFLIADPTEAWVLETTGRKWAARSVRERGQGMAISNRITLRHDFSKAAATVGPDQDIDQWRDPSSPPGHADRRLAVTRAVVDPGPGRARSLASGGPAPTPGDFVAVLRHHGEQAWGSPERPATTPTPAPSAIPAPAVSADGEGVTVCMHVRDFSVTAGSMVAWLPADPAEPLRTWAALAAPCVSVYVPIPRFPPDPASGPIAPCLHDAEMWARFDLLRQRAEADDGALAAIRSVLDPLERDLWREDDGSQPPVGSPEADCARIHEALRRLGV